MEKKVWRHFSWGDLYKHVSLLFLSCDLPTHGVKVKLKLLSQNIDTYWKIFNYFWFIIIFFFHRWFFLRPGPSTPTPTSPSAQHWPSSPSASQPSSLFTTKKSPSSRASKRALALCWHAWPREDPNWISTLFHYVCWRPPFGGFHSCSSLITQRCSPRLWQRGRRRRRLSSLAMWWLSVLIWLNNWMYI